MTLGIIGAGLSGLSLSHFVPDSKLLEASPRPGGLMKSVIEEGFTFDLSGGHIFFSKNKEVLDFMLSVLGDNVCQRTRNTKIYYNNKLMKYPFENGLSTLPKEENFACVSDFVQSQYHSPPPQNFEDYLNTTYGPSIAQKYLIPYNEKIWKFPLDQMSAHWCKDRLPQPSIPDILKSSLGIQSEGYTHQLNFYYPRVGGIEAFISALSKGKDVVTSQEVIHIEHRKKWHVNTKDLHYEFDNIVSTIPLISLIYCLDDVPEEVTNAVNSLKYNSLITVMIGVNYQPRLYSWIYYPDKDHIYHRVNFLSNFSDRVTPDGYGSYIFEITCPPNKLNSLSDSQLISKVLDQADILQSEVVYTRVHRTKFAYVIYDLAYQKNIQTVQSFLKTLGIKTLGRFAEWEYYNMDNCIEKAMEIARSINQCQ